MVSSFFFCTFALLFGGRVAQPVEHIPFKDGVLGSNPSATTPQNLNVLTNKMLRFLLSDLYPQNRIMETKKTYSTKKSENIKKNSYLCKKINNMDITGQLIKILPEYTGQGVRGPWVKQEFVIETKEQFPKKICFSTWGDKVEMLRKFGMSDMVKVSFNAESREHNERWYTELRAWRIDRFVEENSAPTPMPAHSNSTPAPASALPAENTEGLTFSNQPVDDLPF